MFIYLFLLIARYQLYDPNALEKVILEGTRTQITGEREFRERIVIRLLEALGWTEPGDIQFEYPIKIGVGSKKADYLIGKNAKFIFEIKSPKVTIEVNDDNCIQAISYLKLVDQASYAALYNGKRLIIFQKISRDPIYIWDSNSDISPFKVLAKDNFPLSLDIFTGKQSPINFNSDAGKTSSLKIIKPVNYPIIGNKKNSFWTKLKILGFFALFSFILGIIFSGLSGSGNVAMFRAALFFIITSFFSLIAFVIEFLRVKIRKLRRRSLN